MAEEAAKKSTNSSKAQPAKKPAKASKPTAKEEVQTGAGTGTGSGDDTVAPVPVRRARAPRPSAAAAKATPATWSEAGPEDEFVITAEEIALMASFWNDDRPGKDTEIADGSLWARIRKVLKRS